MENMKTRSLLKIKGLSLHLIDEVTGMSLADQPEGKVNQIFNVTLDKLHHFIEKNYLLHIS